ncbi:glycosyltransferase family 2 protein [uncultured Shimia sp.]|uniref:glycosyltransferase family 2 protein n=1 Tax=uncultured Shimia sp. TaxID=573152 RepID=UPI002614A5BC|nr:glycosyltransferase family 2 protein [uncultured Shimia sp.]
MRILSVTSVRNEGSYLLEWIAHHKAAGVTDFLIFSNDCDDGTNLMLNTLDQAGIVTHISHEREKNKSIQWQALRAAWKHPLRKEADWILVSDVDEFINIHAGNHDIASLLSAVPAEADGIIMPWRLYGHNDVVGIEDQPVTQQFTRAISPDTNYPVSAGMFKTLFRTRGPFRQLGVHRPKQKPEENGPLPILVDGSGAILPEWFARNQQRLSLFGVSSGRSLVEMNHYAVRSAAGFLIKRDRGLPNRSKKPVDLSYWVERNFNTVEDTSIHQMRPATEAVLHAILQIANLQDLHAEAMKWHRSRFDTLVRDPETHQLLTQILTAGGSTVLPEQLQRQLVRLYQETNKPGS